MQPKYPDIHISLTGRDGNAFTILGLCLRAARSAGLAESEITEFQAEAIAGDYDHLLRTVQKWFECS